MVEWVVMGFELNVKSLIDFLLMFVSEKLELLDRCRVSLKCCSNYCYEIKKEEL